MFVGKTYNSSRGPITITRISRGANYGFYLRNGQEHRIHCSQIRSETTPPADTIGANELAKLAEEVVDSDSMVDAERVRASLLDRQYRNKQTIAAIRKGSANPSWFHRALDITPTAVMAYTGGISGLVALAITLYNYVL